MAGIEGRTPLAPSLLAPCYPDPASPPVQEIASSCLASPPPSTSFFLSSFLSFLLSTAHATLRVAIASTGRSLISSLSILRSNNIRVSCVSRIYIYIHLADLFSSIIYIYTYNLRSRLIISIFSKTSGYVFPFNHFLIEKKRGLSGSRFSRDLDQNLIFININFELFNISI